MDVCKGRLTKKMGVFKLKIEAHPVNAGRWTCCMAFKHSISLAINLAANFGFESRLTSFPNFCLLHSGSEVAGLFDSNLSKGPFLGQVVHLDLLLCTGFDSEHAVLLLCHSFTQRPMTDRKI